MARAASLRADAKLWLLRLATHAQREARKAPPDLATLRPLIEETVARLNDYGDYVRRALLPGPSFEHFERRTRGELAQLASHVERAPRSTAVAHRAYVTARMLVGELDSQGRDFGTEDPLRRFGR